jgi:hypothetical protein
MQVLQEFRQNGQLHAQLPGGVLGLRQGQVFIDLVQGQAITCYIINEHGQIVMEGNNAMQVAFKVGTLDWVVEEVSQQTGPLTNPYLRIPRQTTSHNLPAIPQQTTPFTGQTPDHVLSYIPQRHIALDAAMLHELSRRSRRVLLLIDGERSISKIASILFPGTDSRQEIIKIMQDLENRGLIRIRMNTK